MRSVQLSKAISSGKVYVRSGRNVTGQTFLKFRAPGVKPKIITPYPLVDQLKDETYINLSLTYSADQLKNSNLEDLVVSGALELKRS
jgi:hypothetical protein